MFQHRADNIHHLWQVRSVVEIVGRVGIGG